MHKRRPCLRGLGRRDGAKRRATPGGWEKEAACSKEGACSWGRGRAQPHRHCTPRLRSAHLQSSPNAQSLAERIAAPDPKVRVGRGLRRLMRNCEEHGRSRNSMLVAPNLRPKVVPHGPRLLPSLIVRTRGRLVAGTPSLLSPQARPSGPALRPRGHYPGHTRAVAALPQREGLLALRLFAPALLLPEAVHPRPVQPQGASPCARAARSAAGLRRGSLRAFGRLP